MRGLLPGAAAFTAMAALLLVFYHGLVLDGLIVGDYDAFVYFYPLRQYAAESLAQGRLPLWNPYLFLGAPFFANIQTAVLYPPNALFLWLPTPHAFSASVVTHVLLAGASMYLFARGSLGVARLPALLAAVTFMFSGFLSNHVGHINQLSVAAWLPLLLWLFDHAVRRNSPALGIAAGLIATLQLLAGHTQQWYFCMVVLGLFALWRVVAPACSARDGRVGHGAPAGTGSGSLVAGFTLAGLGRRLRPLAYLVLVGVVETGLSAVQLLPTMELSDHSIRGGGLSYGEAVSFSMPPTTALHALLPTYPAELSGEFVGYVGIVPLLLAMVAVARWGARPVALFMACLAALGLFLALGGYNPLYPFFFENVPGMDLFRVPARWLFVYTFGVAGLAGLGAQLVADLSDGSRRRGGTEAPGQPVPAPARIPVAALVLGMGFVALLLFAWVARPRPAMVDIQSWGALAALALGLMAVASLGRRAAWISLSLLLALVAGELWVAGGDMVFRHPVPAQAYRPERTSTSFILADAARHPAPGRLLSFATDQYEVKETPDYKKDYAWLSQEALTRFMVAIKLSEAMAPNVPMEYGIETVDGYDGGVLPLRRYAELKSILMPVPGIPADNQLRTHLDYVPPMRFLDLLNVRYVLGTKLQDARIDNVYYDRGITLLLEPERPIHLRRMPDIMATSLGVISSTEGARQEKDGVPAALLTLVDVSGATYEVPLRLGVETGETSERDGSSPPAAHRKPAAVGAWTPAVSEVNYFAKIPLPDRIQIKEIALKAMVPGSKVRIRALTLIDDVAAHSSPLVLSDRMDRELFFDMKVYTSRDPLPRAFVVHNSTVREGQAALEALKLPQFDPAEMVVLAPSATARAIHRPALLGSGPSDARLLSYRPEGVELEVELQHEGYLVLLDSFYPGWTAQVDGRGVPIERANHHFRAVYLEPGRHSVVFSYSPDSFETGLRISLASLGLLSVVLAGLGLRWWRRGRTRAL